MGIRPVRNGYVQRHGGTRRRTSAGLVVMTCMLVVAGMLTAPFAASAAESPVGLGTTESYSVLGGQAVTNTGPSTLSDNLGVSPGTAVTGFPPGTVGGTVHAADAHAAQAQSDLVIAYDDAAGRAPTASVSGDLVGQTLTAGVYTSTGPLELSGALTLDGQGDPNSVFIFQVASTLITASSSDVVLTNGAQACNVFWQVGSSATLGTASTFTGTIMALTSVTVTTGTVVEGRALARNGQVSLDTNVFTTPTCDTEPPTEPPTEAPVPPTEPPTDAPTGPPTDAPTGPPTEAPTGPATEAPTGPATDAPTGPATEAHTGPATGTPTGVTTESPTSGPADGSDDGTPHLPVTGPSAVGPLVGMGALLLILGLLAVRRTRLLNG